MAWPDPSTIDWSSGVVSFFAYINTVSLGWASRMFLIGIYLIVLSGYYKARDDFVGGVAAAGVATFIIGFIGFLLEPQFVDWVTFSFTIAIAFVGAAALLLDRSQGTA